MSYYQQVLIVKNTNHKKHNHKQRALLLHYSKKRLQRESLCACPRKHQTHKQTPTQKKTLGVRRQTLDFRLKEANDPFSRLVFADGRVEAVWRSLIVIAFARVLSESEAIMMILWK